MGGESYVFGTSPDCDVRVTNEYVSTRHARVWRDDSGFTWVEDLGSTNGTYMISGTHGLMRVYGPTRIQPGDKLLLSMRCEIRWTR
jgi:pSer/pThr/pTyr-binding forkhead associated (FHA) protein